jgi:hypothetical protein
MKALNQIRSFMKVLVLTLVMLTSFSVVAGPEDRRDDTCFRATSPVTSFIPAEFCFEGASLDLNSDKLFITGYGSNVPAELGAYSVTRKNEDYYSFKAKTTIANKWETGCGDGEFAELNIKGLADYTGAIEASSLSLSVNFEVTNDTCHSRPQVGLIEYELVK